MNKREIPFLPDVPAEEAKADLERVASDSGRKKASHYYEGALFNIDALRDDCDVQELIRLAIHIDAALVDLGHGRPEAIKGLNSRSGS